MSVINAIPVFLMLLLISSSIDVYAAETNTGELQAPVAQSVMVNVHFVKAVKVKYTDDAEIELETKGFLPWKELSLDFPGIDLRRLFTSVSPEDIEKMVNEAKLRNPTYEDPGFLRYFIILVPSGIDADKLVEVLLKNPNIERAYVEPNRPEPIYNDE